MFDAHPSTATVEADPSTTAVASDYLTAEFEAMFGDDASSATPVPAAVPTARQNPWDRYSAHEMWDMLELSQQTAAARGAQLKTVENLLSVQQDISAGQAQKLADLQQQIATAQHQIAGITAERDKYQTDRDNFLQAANRAAEAHKKATAQLASATTASTLLQSQLADQKQQTEAAELQQRSTQADLNRTSLLTFFPISTVICAMGAWFDNAPVQLLGYLLAVMLFALYLKSPAKWWSR